MGRGGEERKMWKRRETKKRTDGKMERLKNEKRDCFKRKKK